MALHQYFFQREDRCQLNRHCLEEHKRHCRHPRHGVCHHIPAGTDAHVHRCMFDDRCREAHEEKCTGCVNRR